MQYASSAINPLTQSTETAGFHEWNWSLVIPNLSTIVAQVSPAAHNDQFRFAEAINRVR